MTEELFDTWSERSVHGFADQQVAAGLTSPAAALAYAREQLAALLPHGLATPTHHLWVVRLAGPRPSPARDDAAGSLWLRVRPGRTGVEATLLDIEVAADLRGRGIGRAAVVAAQHAAEDLGATVLRLTVFGHNLAALALYTGLGFTVERALLSRRLGAAGSGGPAPRKVRLDPDGHPGGALGPLAPGAGDHRWDAWDGDRRVGRLVLRVDRAEVLADGERRVGVDLQVLPEARGRGYGRALLAAAEVESRDLGGTVMTATLTGRDTAQQGFYERVGFGLTAQLMARPLAGRPAGHRSGWPSA